MRRVSQWRRRPFRFPRYGGAAYWTTFLCIFGYATLNSGLLWGWIFGVGFLILLSVFLWWYGVLPVPQRAQALDDPPTGPPRARRNRDS
jgi:hypothetical protein